MDMRFARRASDGYAACLAAPGRTLAFETVGVMLGRSGDVANGHPLCDLSPRPKFLHTITAYTIVMTSRTMDIDAVQAVSACCSTQGNGYVQNVVNDEYTSTNSGCVC
jgi:hypothetical protein